MELPCQSYQLHSALSEIVSLVFSFCREKVTTLEVSIAKCLEVLSTRLLPGRSDLSQQPDSISEGVLYVFPAWHVNHFLLKLRTAFHRGGLHKFLTKELKVLHVA